MEIKAKAWFYVAKPLAQVFSQCVVELNLKGNFEYQTADGNSYYASVEYTAEQAEQVKQLKKCNDGLHAFALLGILHEFQEKHPELKPEFEKFRDNLLASTF